MDDLATAIGCRIRSERKRRGIRQNRLADMIGVKTQTLWDYEHGRIKNIGIDPLCKLADALGVSVDYLLGRSDNA